MRLKEEINLFPLRMAIKIAHRFVTGPEGMVDYYRRHYGIRRDKVVVLYNHVNASAWREARQRADPIRLRRELMLPSDARLVLYVGRISRFKAGAFILPFAHALFAYPDMDDVHLVCVGPIELAGFRKEHEHFPWRERVHLVGPVPGYRVLNYHLTSNAFILPTGSEGFPRALLEAMASGLPFVAFDVGGVREIVGPALNAYVVKRGDLRTMATLIRQLLNSPEEADRVSHEAMSRAALFDTQPMAEMFVSRIGSDGECG